jgi:hypothetical protein
VNAWKSKLRQLQDSHPLCNAHWLDDPRRIEHRLAGLKNKISSEQDRLEYLGMVYTAAMKTFRFCN